MHPLKKLGYTLTFSYPSTIGKTLISWRKIAVLPNDYIVSVDINKYDITVFDHLADRVVKRVSGAGSLWDGMSQVENGDTLSPIIQHIAVFDGDDVLWIKGTMPDQLEGWSEVRSRARREGRDVVAPSNWDLDLDTFIEIIDLNEDRVLGSFRLDIASVGLVAPHKIGYYPGDLPYPRIQIIELQETKEIGR